MGHSPFPPPSRAWRCSEGECPRFFGVHAAHGLPDRSGTPCRRRISCALACPRPLSPVPCPLSPCIAYGSTGGFSGPGVSTDVESISVQSLGRRLARERGAAQVGDLLDGLARREAVRDLADLPLGVAEHQQVGLRVHQHRAAHLLRPVVEVRDAPERRLDAADHDRHVLVRLPGALRVHDHAAVGPRAGHAVRGVGVVAADAAVRGVAVHHRIHVAAGDAEEQVRLAQAHEVAGRVPVGLGDDADAEALRLEHAADDGHAEAGVVHVGVARDDDDVAGIPAERVHLRPRRGQERRRAEPVRPVLAVGEQVAGGLHGAQFRRGGRGRALSLASALEIQ